MIGSFAQNVLPLLESTVDNTVQLEQPDDNDVTDAWSDPWSGAWSDGWSDAQSYTTETDDESDGEWDMNETGSDWNDHALPDPENIFEEKPFEEKPTEEKTHCH